MTTEKYAVLIAGIAKAGMEEYVKRSLTQLMNSSRHDKGCILYHIHQSINHPSEFMVYMLWKDKAAFELHNQKPDMQEFKNQLASVWFEAQSPKTDWLLLE